MLKITEAVIQTFMIVKNGVFWDVTPRGLEEPHGVTAQKTPFFIVTTMKTSKML
jgi:hypothetical protein